MIRKVVVGTLTAAVIGGMVFGKEMFSYARTGFHSARDRIRSEVPIQFELERARDEVEKLLPAVRRAMHRMAQEQVEVEQLQTSIARREKSLESQENAILSLSSDLKTGQSKFRYAGRSYTQVDVEKDLAERFNRFKILEETLSRERQVLAAKEQALTANRETLEGMLSQKKNLEAELERLQARMRTIEARQEIHGLDVDDSQLTRAKTLIATIEKRLDVEDAVLAAEGDLQGLIPIELEQAETDNANVAQQVEDYFRARQGQTLSGDELVNVN